MAGKVIAGMISFSLLLFLILMIAFFFLQETIKSEVNQINYHLLEITATGGMLTTPLWQGFQEEISRYGDFQMTIKLERELKPGVYDIYFGEEAIVDLPLTIGDRLTVYLEDKNPSLFRRLLTAGTMGYQPEALALQGIRSVKTAIIAKNGRDLVKGYEVLLAIEQYQGLDQVAIFVSTKRSTTGKYYGSSSHPEILVTNLDYGDDGDEQGSTAPHYIYEYGDFLRNRLFNEAGELVKLEFIQQ